jgi:hypothetical protein
MVAGSVCSSELSAQGGAEPSGTAARARSALARRGSTAARFAGDEVPVAVEDAEHRAAADGVVGQGRQPAEQDRILPGAADGRHGQLHQVRRTVDVAGSQRVQDRVLDQVVGLGPAAGPQVQHRDLLGLLALQAGPQDVGEQVVVAVPLPPVVQGDDEEVGALERRQHVAAVGAAGDGVAQRAREPVEDSGVQQEPADRVGLVLQDLLDQVVHDVPVVAGEPGDEPRGVLTSAEGERGELQRGDPPLRPLLQCGDVGGGEVQSRRLGEVGGGLVRGEPQVRGTDLDQLASRPPPGQGQAWVGTGADDHEHVGWKVLQQGRHPLADVAAVGQVVVVEHQPDPGRCGGELVDQRGDHEVGRHGGGCEQLQGA